MSLLCESFPFENEICVNTGEVKYSNLNLVTSFVNTCTVLAFKIKDNNFMAHIDAINPNMEKIVLNQLKNLNIKDVREVHIWKGNKCANYCPSFKIAEKILKIFPTNTKIIYNKTTNDVIKI